MEDTKKNRLKNSFFSKFDAFIFQKIDIFLQTPTYQKIQDKFSELDSQSQKYSNHLITLILLLLPLYLIFHIYLGNSSLKNELELKQSIITKIHQFRSNQALVNTYHQNYSSPVTLDTRQAFETHFRPRIQRHNIQSQQVKIQSYDFYPISSSYAEAILSLKLKDMTLTEFSNLLSVVLTDYKMQPLEIEITKNDNNQLLSGTLNLTHIQKSQTEANES